VIAVEDSCLRFRLKLLGNLEERSLGELVASAQENDELAFCRPNFLADRVTRRGRDAPGRIDLFLY